MLYQFAIHAGWVVFAVLLGRALLGVLKATRLDPTPWVRKKLRLSQFDSEGVAETVRWGMVTIVVGLCIGTLYAADAIADRFGPHEGDPADLVLNIENVTVEKSQYYPEVPYGINIYYSAKARLKECHTAELLMPESYLTPAEADREFDYLVRTLDIMISHSDGPCAPLTPGGKPALWTAFAQPPSFINEKKVKEVAAGNGEIYAVMVWEYTLDSDPSVHYIREYCAAYVGGLSSPKSCMGDHDRSYKHMVQ